MVVCRQAFKTVVVCGQALWRLAPNFDIYPNTACVLVPRTWTVLGVSSLMTLSVVLPILYDEFQYFFSTNPLIAVDG